MTSRELVKNAGRGTRRWRGHGRGRLCGAGRAQSRALRQRERFRGRRERFPARSLHSGAGGRSSITRSPSTRRPMSCMAAAKELELLEVAGDPRDLPRSANWRSAASPTRGRIRPTLMEQMQSIGWVVLAERAGREIVFGSVTQPWQAAPVFRSIPADQFKDFSEPGYVKIAWTLRADPVDDTHSIFHTETRVCTTDAAGARALPQLLVVRGAGRRADSRWRCCGP